MRPAGEEQRNGKPTRRAYNTELRNKRKPTWKEMDIGEGKWKDTIMKNRERKGRIKVRESVMEKKNKRMNKRERRKQGNNRNTKQ